MIFIRILKFILGLTLIPFGLFICCMIPVAAIMMTEGHLESSEWIFAGILLLLIFAFGAYMAYWGFRLVIRSIKPKRKAEIA